MHVRVVTLRDIYLYYRAQAAKRAFCTNAAFTGRVGILRILSNANFYKNFAFQSVGFPYQLNFILKKLRHSCGKFGEYYTKFSLT